MNFKILLIAISAVSITGCSTAYKSGQTPDDVYYSPVRVIEEDDSRNEEEREEVRNDSYEEREIRMATRDRRWRDYDDDYNCRYDPYRYGYTHGYYYNPYYNKYPVYLPGAVVTNPKNTVARMTNLSSYNTVAVTSNGKTGTNTWISTQRPYNNSNNRREGFVRRVIEPVLSGSSNRSSSDNNSRTYTPSSNNSNSGSSSGSKSTPVTRPGRGN